MHAENWNNQNPGNETLSAAKLLQETAELFREEGLRPLAFGATYAATNLAADHLTGKTLRTLPEARTGSVKWWQNNSSAANGELFSTQQADLRAVAANLEMARIRQTAAIYDYGQTLRELQPHTAALNTRIKAFEQASGSAFKAEAQALYGLAAAPASVAVEEADRFLAGKNLALNNPRTAELVKSLREAIKLDRAVPGSTYQLLNLHARDMEVYAERPTLRSSDLNIMRQQHETLVALAENPTKVQTHEVLAKIGTARDQIAGNKVFIRGTEMSDLVETAAHRLHATRVEAVHTLEAESALKYETMISARVHGPADSIGGVEIRRLGVGIGLSCIFTAGGYGIDRAIAGQDFKDTNSGGARLALDGCLVPAFLLNDMPLKYRIPLAATAFGAGRARSAIASDFTLAPQWEHVLRPNQADTFLTGGAVMTPLGTKYKAFAIAGALAAGRAVNMLQM